MNSPDLLAYSVMAGPGHPRLSWISISKAWMPGTRPGMTHGSENALKDAEEDGAICLSRDLRTKLSAFSRLG
ncbi:hypothetical protein D4Q52_22245 [Rhodopseudomonas palustris]|uniref:Uncharacterized protein n=1 Tax=Rhodopseudomonas palustris TaxID=1076 RepID=A0A418UYR6_RHOPL|nr:hypothetical protein D4Q52_22245 [Rhodopseudomonas palustris]